MVVGGVVWVGSDPLLRIIITLIVLFHLLDLLVHVLVAGAEVELEGHAVVADGQVELPNTIITAPPIKIRIRILRIYFYHPAEIFDSLFIPRQALI